MTAAKQSATVEEISDPAVRAVFDAYAPETRQTLLKLRSIILETASGLDRVGAVTETLKWGQPSYLPARPRVGTTVRIDARNDADGACAMFFHCQTRLVDHFRELYPDAFAFEGNRALVFRNDDAIPAKALGHCVALALTYHLDKKKR